ncbi:HvfC/BufC N-terminal domain-containing protein [Actibacterium sp. D379-3]
MTGQIDFASALLDPAAAVPRGLIGPDGAPAGKRFAVYRNNVAVGLSDALEAAFPVLRALVGDDFFRAMAGVFLRAHPPETPLMMFYGAAMPAFLGRFAPARHLPYLPDIARLELALRESYHAADATPLAPEALTGLPPERLMQARLVLAPALRLIRSPYPVAGIWLAHQGAEAPKPQMRAEDALIARPGFDPTVTCLPPGGGAFIRALQAGKPLGAAIVLAETEFTVFNLTDVLGLLIQNGGLIDIKHEVLA